MLVRNESRIKMIHDIEHFHVPRQLVHTVRLRLEVGYYTRHLPSDGMQVFNCSRSPACHLHGRNTHDIERMQSHGYVVCLLHRSSSRFCPLDWNPGGSCFKQL